jgi:hypothetical protein
MAGSAVDDDGHTGHIGLFRLRFHPRVTQHKRRQSPFQIVIPAERSESRDPSGQRWDGSRLGAMLAHRLAGMTI